jgi:branched-chain amino acid transport system substrate-binding protein
MKSHSFLSSITRLVIIFLLLASVATPLQANAAPSAILPAIVKIGVIYPFTGSLAPWGQEAGPFLNQAEVDINSLAPGVTFQLVPRTSDGTPAGALLAAQDLIELQGVRAIVGLPTSPELSGAIDYLREKHVAVISSTSTASAPELRQPDNVYRIMPNELYLARNMADMILTRGYTRVAIIRDAGSWGRDYSDELVARLQASGIVTESVLIVSSPSPTPISYTAEIADLANKTGILSASGLTAVVMVVKEGDDLILLNQAAAFPTLQVPWFSAMAGPEILTGTYSGLPLLGGSNFAYVRGLWSQEHLLPQGGVADALLTQAQASLGSKPRAEHVYVYDAIQLMARAILLAGTYDGPAITAQIPAAAASYPAATGPFFFDGNGDRDGGDLAYTCLLPMPTGSPYQYHYCAYFHGTSLIGSFDIRPDPEPRDLEWLR